MMNRTYFGLSLPSLLLTVCMGILTPLQTHAFNAGQFRFGLVGGQVGLLGDPGSGGANGIGAGFSAANYLDDKLALEIQYLASSHANVDHRELSVGAEYYFSDYEKAYPHVSGGMSFLGNRFKTAGASGDAVGLYIGGGLGFELRRDLMVGPEVRLQKAFEAKGPVAGRTITTVGDSYTVLLRLMYSPQPE